MDLSAWITFLKLLGDSGVVSPKRDAPTPPSSKAGLRPDCGQGKKAVLVDDKWVCIPLFD
jgi:hypothetical protein